MSNLRRAAQQALEALESAKMNHGKMLLSDPPQEAWRFHRVDETLSAAITALRAALAEPEQPVATWENKYGMKEWEVHAIRAGWMPAPTPRKPLTDEEHEDLMRGRSTLDYGRAVEATHGITGETK